jgi:hypothetical protein
MLSHGLASEEKLSAKGEKKVKIRFEQSWVDLRRAVRGEDAGPKFAAVIKAARESLGG